MIEPRVLKGFRDFLPETMILKKELIKRLESVFESFGFVPIDTPALEYTEILLGKGGGETDKQIYRFNDHGGRDIALRYDLTVPLARFVSEHYGELNFPFKRYHIAPVWRGENTQKGRYREFYQCDFDILGSNSVNSDLEILLTIKEGFKVLNAGDFRININNRKILNSFLKKFDLLERSADVLRTIDKIYKIGVEEVVKELSENLKIGISYSWDIINILGLDNENKMGFTGDEIFETFEKYKSKLDNEEATKNIEEIESIFKTLKEMDLLNYFAYNPAITRGLDYYTGIVFESFILDRVEFGSVCSGGRYDNLTGLYSKNVVTGVGASFGLDRLLALMEDKNILEKKSTKTALLIFNLDSNKMAFYNKLADYFRKNGINTEVIYEKQKIGNQFKFAEKKAIKYVLIAGEEEIKTEKFNLKNIISGDERKSLSKEEIIQIIC
ncbi:MAG: histidine--tRNA ligase [Spirochaetes bacterium GWD1_27_9]|nr:MAG: histidine--tRNA ligase [Spirochaetes bacterium GWC1_27_15]OHD36557.1 MAG: histidine--tRNA ligase [Spirochaetes bacterium GWD1_27_9]